ncbi:hypothetical protein [Streptomyces sp. YIM S03343]
MGDGAKDLHVDEFSVRRITQGLRDAIEQAGDGLDELDAHESSGHPPKRRHLLGGRWGTRAAQQRASSNDYGRERPWLLRDHPAGGPAVTCQHDHPFAKAASTGAPIEEMGAHFVSFAYLSAVPPEL